MIYLVAITANPTIYPEGTRIGTIKYTVPDTATIGDKITINVTGNIQGENSDERNTMNESITIGIGKAIDDEEIISPTGITLDSSIITMTEGETKKITATVTPSGASQELTWKSNNTKVATVDQTGNIKAVGEGTTQIIVTTKDGTISKEILVTVERNNIDNEDNEENENQNNGEQSSTTGQKEDTTTANQSIPQTGENIGVIVVGLALLAGGIIVLIKYKRQ